MHHTQTVNFSISNKAPGIVRIRMFAPLYKDSSKFDEDIIAYMHIRITLIHKTVAMSSGNVMHGPLTITATNGW